MLSIIAAIGNNRVIGQGNKLLWHLPKDFQFFKRQTVNKKILMGRSTWDSLPIKPLPNRHNIVVSRKTLVLPTGVEQWHDLEKVGSYCAKNDELMVIGGAQIYEQLLPLAQRLYITRVDVDLDGDAFFPAFDGGWQCISEQWHNADAQHRYQYAFTLWERKAV